MNDAAVNALIRLEAADATLNSAFTTTAVVAAVFVASLFGSRFMVREWRRGWLDRKGEKAFAAAMFAACALSGAALPFAIATDAGARAAALADLGGDALCARILGDVSDGTLKFVQNRSVNVLADRCGRERFLVAANAPGSVLSAELGKGLFR